MIKPPLLQRTGFVVFILLCAPAVVTSDSVVFEGVSPDTTVPVMRVVADSAGMVRLVN